LLSFLAPLTPEELSSGTSSPGGPRKKGRKTLVVQGTISMWWGNMAYCVKLSGEGSSHYWSKIESAGLRKCPYYNYLIKKVMSQ